jgi:hypothetical protein
MLWIYFKDFEQNGFIVMQTLWLFFKKSFTSYSRNSNETFALFRLMEYRETEQESQKMFCFLRHIKLFYFIFPIRM